MARKKTAPSRPPKRKGLSAYPNKAFVHYSVHQAAEYFKQVRRA